MRTSIDGEHERLVRMLKESITLMCKSSLTYDLELNIEGLLGITLDKKDIFLVNINESFQTETQKQTEKPAPERQSVPQKRGHSDLVEIKEEDRESPSPSSRKRRTRRRSRDSTELRAVHSDNITGDFELPEFSSSQRLSADDAFGDFADQNAPSTASTSASLLSHHHHHIGNSRDGNNAPVDAQSGISHSALREGASNQGQLDFDSIVIKQEVGDTIEDDDDDVTFAGESFEGPMLYPGSLPLGAPPGGGEVPPSQLPPVFPGPSTDGSQPPGVRYPCHYCDKDFKSRLGRNKHENLHMGKGTPCPYCPLLFESPWKMRRHKATHDRSPQPQMFAVQCPENS